MRPIPQDFLQALRRSGLEDFFDDCPYVPRAEYLSWIAAARRSETRRWRIQRSVVRLFQHWADEVRTIRRDFDAGRTVLPSSRRWRFSRPGRGAAARPH